MPIMGSAEQDPISTMGNQFHPSERFGAATMQLDMPPGPPPTHSPAAYLRSPGRDSLLQGSGPGSVGSSGRYSSQPIHGNESLFPMYQY